MTWVSNLNRFLPRPAAVASGSPAQQYQQAVEDAQKAVALRRRLPRTQDQFYADRLNSQ